MGGETERAKGCSMGITEKTGFFWMSDMTNREYLTGGDAVFDLFGSA